MFRSYLRLLVFAASLLIGLQIPSFVDQYAERVHAHWLEAQSNFAGFQKTAEQHFNGDVIALITHHRASDDAVFRDEARTIEANYERMRMLAREWQDLQVPLIKRLMHMVREPHGELLHETLDHYSYNVPLNPAAMLSGILVGFLSAFLLEMLGLFLLASLGRVMAPKKRPAVRPDLQKTQPVATAASRRF